MMESDLFSRLKVFFEIRISKFTELYCRLFQMYRYVWNFINVKVQLNVLKLLDAALQFTISLPYEIYRQFFFSLTTRKCEKKNTRLSWNGGN